MTGVSQAPGDQEDGLREALDDHMPWARAEFAAQTLWMACSCGWNAMREADGSWIEHFDAATRLASTEDPT